MMGGGLSVVSMLCLVSGTSAQQMEMSIQGGPVMILEEDPSTMSAGAFPPQVAELMSMVAKMDQMFAPKSPQPTHPCERVRSSPPSPLPPLAPPQR